MLFQGPWGKIRRYKWVPAINTSKLETRISPLVWDADHFTHLHYSYQELRTTSLSSRKLSAFLGFPSGSNFIIQLALHLANSN